MDTINFPQWIKDQREARGWSQSEFSRAANISRQVVSDYEGYKRKYFDDDILIKIAHAFKFPPEIVFRAAGILPPVTKSNERIAKFSHLVEKLNENDIDDLYALALTKLRRQEAAQKAKLKVKQAEK